MTKEEKPNIGRLSLTNVRLAFPALFKTADPYEEGQQRKYQATFLIPKDSPQIAKVNEVINAVAKDLWGAKAEVTLKGISGNNMKYCFQDGDAKTGTDGYEGHWYLSAKSTVRPTVVDRDKSPLTEEDGRPYGGCYVNASVEIYAQKKNGAAIRASLRGVQFYKEGDAFAGGAPADADEFDDLSDSGDEEALA